NIEMIKSDNITITHNIKNIFVHKIGSFVIFQTDAILITIFSTLKETAIYANYTMIISSLTGLLSNAIGSIMPSIGNLIAEESREKSYDIFRKLYILDHIIAIFVSIVTYTVINEFVVFWVGKEYLFSKYIVLSLIINLYIQISRGTVDRFKDGFGIYWDVGAPIIESIVNLIFSIVLAKYIGIVGIFIGTIISNILIVEFWKPYVLFKEGFRINVFKYIDQAVKVFSINMLIIFFSNLIYKKVI
ncbi:lipopolysaccharide biosynthesis protein, partial [Clostridium perfringens]